MTPEKHDFYARKWAFGGYLMLLVGAIGALVSGFHTRQLWGLLIVSGMFLVSIWHRQQSKKI
jgi:hypothetical protein